MKIASISSDIFIIIFIRTITLERNKVFRLFWMQTPTAEETTCVDILRRTPLTVLRTKF